MLADVASAFTIFDSTDDDLDVAIFVMMISFGLRQILLANQT